MIAKKEGGGTSLPFFAYGTLMRGECGYVALALSYYSRYLGPARIAGTLYDLGSYPAARLTGSGAIIGELFEITDPAIITLLDDYEDFDPASPDTSEYTRATVSLIDRHGGAWTYAFNREPVGYPVIASGNWQTR